MEKKISNLASKDRRQVAKKKKFMHVMNSISEREWLKSYFNKREGRRQNEKGKKAKVKTESEADYAQDWLESHKSTGNKII